MKTLSDCAIMPDGISPRHVPKAFLSRLREAADSEGEWAFRNASIEGRQSAGFGSGTAAPLSTRRGCITPESCHAGPMVEDIMERL